MNKFSPRCSYCKQHVAIVKSVRGMHYCESHKDKAPTKGQYEAFMNEKVTTFTTPKFIHSGYRNVEKSL